MPNDLNDLPLNPIGGAQPNPNAAPLNDVTPSAAEPSRPAAPETPEKSDEILAGLPVEVQKLPVVRMLAIGEPPGFRVEPGQYFPELEPIGANLDKVLRGGLDIYKSQAGEVVVFNPLFVGEAELKAADASGKLGDVVPPYGELTGSEPQEVSDEKFRELAAHQENTPAKMQALSVEEPQPAVAAEPPPARVQSQINSARVQNVKPQAPTSGPAPGAGRVLNGLLKRAV